MRQAPRLRPPGCSRLTLLFLSLSTFTFGENVVLKNGIVYRGSVDQDNTIVFIDDGLKRVVVRDSKIARKDPDTTFGHWEIFKLEQPLVLHGGVMPKEALAIKTTAWNEQGRRQFEYRSAKSNQPISMEQAIYELGPYKVRLRGVDGFWQDGRLSTKQIPREIVLSILAKVDSTNLNERRRVASFLIQAEWYNDAKRELDNLIRDFPDDASLRETIGNARTVVAQLESAQIKADLDVRRKAQQYHEVMNRLKTFPTKDVAADVLVDVRDQVRRDEAQVAADEGLAKAFRSLSERISSDAKKTWKAPVNEMLRALAEAPEAVRDRFVAWQKAKDDPAIKDDAQFALAVSGYLVGADAAVTSLEMATSLWKLRDQLHTYLSTSEAGERTAALDQLQTIPLPERPGQTVATLRLDLLTRLAIRMPPPLDTESDKKTKPGEPTLHRVREDENLAPTEYSVLLPPEYHPLRSYPAVVALHDGRGPSAAIDWWSAEATRRGYIVIAPEYRLPDQGDNYTYSTSEHAAVELALRDARRRYAIDGDRVFLGGQLRGGDMAWDYGLAHPDLFAGVAVISGLPFKYAFRYQSHAKLVPLYVGLGDLAPAGPEIVFQNLLKPLIAKTYDVTYVEYYRRGLEDLPEEATAVFDWMDCHRREPFPKEFDAVTARESDDRFYGVVVREFFEGRSTAPEVVEPFGKNLKPATIKMSSSHLSNLIKIQTNGVKRLDVWVSPKLIDFNRKIEVRINKDSFIKPVAEPNIEPFLEDLRLRGDRQQIFWLKASWISPGA
ncbi:PHB depolymerase family esterase [Singulisphaera sp. Ch08]|uniref:PHB depolymerase family esterase n=1 Tax=Singulisphaera sp. Ch08 TaxID=3120278 RepID=A0AAU7CSC6_9BACT